MTVSPWSATRLTAATAVCVLLTVLVGRALVVEPKLTCAAVLAALVVAAATTAPRAAAMLAIATYAISLEQRFQAPPEATKALVIMLALPFAVIRGIDVRRLAPVAAYAILFGLTFLGATRLDVLTPIQTVSSFITLTMGWALFAIRYRRDDAALLLPLLALLPLLSLGVGVLLQLGGRGALVASESSGAPRLAGATLAPYLAMLACVGVASAALWWRLWAARLAPLLLAVNAIVLVFTLTRGAIIGTIILLLPAGARLLRLDARGRPEAHLLRVGAIVVALAFLVVAAAPLISSRNETSSRSINQGDAAFNTSGRLDAWKEFYALAQVNPLFGRGLGAGPVAQVETQGFRAQHNEYVRMLLEGGWIGGAIVLVAIVSTLCLAVRRAPPHVRTDLAFLLLGFLVFSATDNTLSAPAFAVPFGVLFGVVACLGDRPSPNAHGGP